MVNFSLMPLAAASISVSVSVSASTLYSTYTFNPLHHLAGIAPYFEPRDPPSSPDAPQGCVVDRAAYLDRHGAIYANDFDYHAYIAGFVRKLANTTSVNWSHVPGLSFLADWRAPITDAEVSLLTRVGRLEATQLGVDLNFRYPNLTLPRHIWASSADRTRQSARALARGLERHQDDSVLAVRLVDESPHTAADSLTPYKSCPAYSSSAGSREAAAFRKRYTAPIVARLRAAAPAFTFEENDVYAMQQLCGYETVIRGQSPFCSLQLFAPDDWLAWEYAEDVRYHYNVGYGSPVAGYNGLPWLNATGSLLLRSADDEDDDHDHELTVSFTHRELPPMVVVAMGLFNNSHMAGAAPTNINDTMPTHRINHRRAWKSSHILPFLGNIALERLQCRGSHGYPDGDYFRALVNSAPQPWPTCDDGPGTSCSRAAFTAYLRERADMFSGFTEYCRAKTYGNNTDRLTLYEANRKNKTMGQSQH